MPTLKHKFDINETDLVRGEERARKECARRQKIEDEKALQETTS